MVFDEIVLIVDDEPDIRETMNELLTIKGFKTIDTDCGEKALAIVKNPQIPIGIVITDIKMPAMSGLDLVKKIHAINEQIICIIITAYATSEAAIEALKYGAYDFIQKPFDVNELNLILKRASEKRQLILQNIHYHQNLENMVQQRTKQIEFLNQHLYAINQLGIINRKDFHLDRKVANIKAFISSNFLSETSGIVILDQEKDRLSAFFDLPANQDTLENKAHIKQFILDMLDRKAKPKIYSKKHSIYDRIKVSTKEKKIIIYPFFKDVYSGYIHLGYGSQEADIMLEQRMEQVIREMETVLHNHYVNMTHNEELKKMFLSSVQTHAHTIEAKDRYTRGHVDRVEAYSGAIASELDISEEEKFELKVACILHDIGKIGVKESILKKPDSLTRQEMKQMMLHPVIGAEIVKDLYGFNLSPIIRHHHERFDGTGYPDGLKGSDIPLGSRIIAVADSFDAMTTDRPYRHAMAPEFAINEIILNKNSQFDPKVVDVFTRQKQKIKKLYEKLKSLDCVHISAFF